MDHDKYKKQNVPTHINISIDLKWADSMKKANLDINEQTLLFEYPDLYYLDLALKYKCDPDQGSAKFDKTRKTLEIKLPVIGMTEESAAIMEANYQKHVVETTKRMNELQVQGEVTEEPETELEQEAKKALENMADIGTGTSKQKQFNMDGSTGISDEYNLTSTKVNMADQDDEDDKGFLNVYDQSKNSEAEVEENVKLDKVKLTQEGVEPS